MCFSILLQAVKIFYEQGLHRLFFTVYSDYGCMEEYKPSKKVIALLKASDNSIEKDLIESIKKFIEAIELIQLEQRRAAWIILNSF